MKYDEDWREKVADCKQHAAGRWDSILTALAPQLIPALEHEGRRHVACPVHGGKDGYRVFKDVADKGATICNSCGVHPDGFATLMWANGWEFWTAFEAVHEFLYGGAVRASVANIRKLPPVATMPKADPAKLKYVLNKVWGETLPFTAVAAEPARLYLARRGITIAAPGAMRFHPSLLYMEGENVIGHFPGIVAMVLGADGKPVTLHRTYLNHDGSKAQVESQKKLMSYPEDRKVMGGAIQLVPAGRVLGVAEGIETSLAAIEATGIPTWATVNARMLEGFVPPEGVEQLIVFTDKDRPTKMHPKGHGQEAAKLLVQKAWKMGIKAAAIVPSGEIPDGDKSLDWLDVLKRFGPQGFPSLDSVRRSMLRAA